MRCQARAVLGCFLEAYSEGTAEKKGAEGAMVRERQLQFLGHKKWTAKCLHQKN